MEDLLDRRILRDRLSQVLPDKNLLLTGMGAEPFEVEDLVDQAATWGERLADHIDDATWLVQAALARGEHVLLEGAQGTLLDLDHGSYPYVTSSNPVAGGACTGGGIGPLQVDEVLGVMKAYATRVGSGPFPTELTDDIGRGIAERGHEVGTTTGRPRRVGWFDAVPLRYAVAVNSISSIMLNKLDILSGLPTLRLCIGYDVAGKRLDHWPSSAQAIEGATPIYQDFPGWEEPIHEVRSLVWPAGKCPPLRHGARRVRRGPDRAGVRGTRTDPDDRTGVAADAPPLGRGPDVTLRTRGRLLMTATMPTRILVLGAGGREHAIAWKLASEPGVNTVFVAPGNAGMTGEPRVQVLPDVDPLDGPMVVAAARRVAAELVVVGPEAPLAAGIADALRAAGFAVFGPDRDAARIETSKSFCHEIAEAAGVRMPQARCLRRHGRGRGLRRDCWPKAVTAWSSRPTASPPARASRSATTRPTPQTSSDALAPRRRAPNRSSSSRSGSADPEASLIVAHRRP